MLNLETDGVTKSLIEKFLTCRRQAHISYVWGLESRGTTTSILIGTLVHDSLNYLNRRIKSGKTPPRFTAKKAAIGRFLDRQHSEYSQKFPSMHPDEVVYCMNVSYALAVGYVQKYNPSLEETEYEFCFTHKKTGMPVRGKIDGIHVDKNGDYWIHEIKTKSRIDVTATIGKLSYDLQAMMYCLAIRETKGVMPKGILYSLIKRPALRTRAGESPESFIARIEEDIQKDPDGYFTVIEGVVDPHEFEAWEKEFDQILSDIAVWGFGKFRNSPRNSAVCSTIYGNCPYIALCSRGDSSGLTPRSRVHRELDYNPETRNK